MLLPDSYADRTVGSRDPGLGTRDFKIVSAPHMTPYMVFIGP
jgi:hypothetical protein